MRETLFFLAYLAFLLAILYFTFVSFSWMMLAIAACLAILCLAAIINLLLPKTTNVFKYFLRNKK
jgi:hypothetical protein